ncbi:MAG: aminopeptidase, partial [Candidatus Nanohaloarchaea archaeon]
IDDGRRNLPGGEVMTAPDHTTLDGTVHFDGTTYFNGHEIGEVTLMYDDGDLAWYDAGTGADDLERLLEKYDNMDRAGELGIGTNPAVKGPMGHLILDEKRRGTVHMALGSAYPECFTVDGQRAGSREAVRPVLPDASYHLDLVKDLSTGELRIDGDPVLVDGELTV